jgi:hypothetical protein
MKKKMNKRKKEKKKKENRKNEKQKKDYMHNVLRAISLKFVSYFN